MPVRQIPPFINRLERMYQPIFHSLYARGFWTAAIVAAFSCHAPNHAFAQSSDPLPVVCATDEGNGNADDPAFWMDSSNPSDARVLVTYKAEAVGQVKMFRVRDCSHVATIDNLDYPNNVDVEFGLTFGGQSIDIAVVTERFQQRILIYEMPELTLRGTVTTDLTNPMGVALYKDSNGEIFAFVSSKNSKSSGTIQRYRLFDDAGEISGEYLGRFGSYDSEVEALSVDDQAGLLYASNEVVRIDVYDADSTDLLDSFGENGFAADREGSAIFPCESGPKVVVSDQGADSFRVFDAASSYGFIGSFQAEGVRDTDGIEVLANQSIPEFPSGIFAAQTGDSHVRLFHWSDVADRIGLSNCGGGTAVKRPNAPTDLQVN